MTEQLFEGEHYIDPKFCFKKYLIIAYKYGSLNPDIVITGHDYRWFREQIEPIKHKLKFKRNVQSKGRYFITPKEVEYIFDLLGKPSILEKNLKS